MKKLGLSSPTCHCASYAFPHRAGGGQCPAVGVLADAGQDERGQVRYKLVAPDLCSACRMPAEPIKADFGVGLTEFWGRVSRHTDVQTVSSCCEQGLTENRPG